MKKKKKLGEMLINADILSEEQLQKALVSQKKSGLKLGQFLVREGIVSESQIVGVISRQLKIEKYSSTQYPLDLGLATFVPAEMAKKYQIAPLRKKGFLLTIAMVDPQDIEALDAVEVYTNTEVEAVICTEQEMNYLLKTLYGAYTTLDEGTEKSSNEADDSAQKQENSPGEIEVSGQDSGDDVPVIRLVNSILSQAITEKVSDIHISPEKDYVQVRFRVDGRLHELPAPPKSMFLPMVSRLKIMANLDIASSRVPQDGRFTVKMSGKEVNIRTSTLPTIYGENVVLRLLDTSGGILTLEQIGMKESDRIKIEKMLFKPYGMILSTGPTGSGKSTTLYSMLHILNTPDINIITLEDPVEFRIPKIRQVQLNQKAGMTFASGLRSILRQDPDVIMVGEIRDAETARISVQAALTGHRVLSTVHTNDSAGAITRFIDMGIEPFLVSSVMLIAIAQRLVRRICKECSEIYNPPTEILESWGIDEDTGSKFKKGRGCFNCFDSGYKGRTGLYEVLVIDEEVQDMIIKRKTSQEIMWVLKNSGKLITLKEDAADKAKRGITTLEEAASAVMT
ncbi:MAG: Flp pilus assembly complex ATPase component TadA [Desulfobacterales bacterium]|nr:Flp pilus assembly complex ATPase component TadA [Desulfobacterales bacterium]